MTVSYRVPSYIVLPGIHALYYGKPALIIAHSSGLKFRLKKSEKKAPFNKEIEQISSMVLDYLTSQKAAYKKLAFEYEIENSNPYMDKSTYSSCLCVAATAAFLKLYSGKDYDAISVNKISYQILKKLNPTALGFETSICSFGGLIYFRREFEFLKNVSQLSFKLSDSIEKHLYIVNTGEPKDSIDQMIFKVGQDYNKEPDKIGKFFSELEVVAKRLVIASIKEDRDFFLENITSGQRQLEKIKIISKKTYHIIKELDQIGETILLGYGGLKGSSGQILIHTKDKKKLDIISQRYNLTCVKFQQKAIGLTTI